MCRHLQLHTYTDTFTHLHKFSFKFSHIHDLKPNYSLSSPHTHKPLHIPTSAHAKAHTHIHTISFTLAIKLIYNILHPHSLFFSVPLPPPCLLSKDGKMSLIRRKMTLQHQYNYSVQCVHVCMHIYRLRLAELPRELSHRCATRFKIAHHI